MALECFWGLAVAVVARDSQLAAKLVGVQLFAGFYWRAVWGTMSMLQLAGASVAAFLFALIGLRLGANVYLVGLAAMVAALVTTGAVRSAVVRLRGR